MRRYAGVWEIWGSALAQQLNIIAVLSIGGHTSHRARHGQYSKVTVKEVQQSTLAACVPPPTVMHVQ